MHSLRSTLNLIKPRPFHDDEGHDKKYSTHATIRNVVVE